MATMHCEIVSAEKELFSGEIEMLSARGTIGELGIMPGHAPLLTGIQPGTVILRLADGTEEIFFASGGFLEIQPGLQFLPTLVKKSLVNEIVNGKKIVHVHP